jgi:hypothetical protein
MRASAETADLVAVGAALSEDGERVSDLVSWFAVVARSDGLDELGFVRRR